MHDDLTLSMMSSSDLILWRCLHGGPLSRENLEHPAPHPDVPWEVVRARNLPLLQKLTEVYGSCAVLAWAGDEVVGTLRYYPKEVYTLYGAGMLCLQQLFPYGPGDDFAGIDFLPKEQLADKTLLIHCLMTGSPSQKENPYQRKGLGSRLVRKLIEWAAENGWEAVETTTAEDLPLLYEISGGAGITFWRKLGFRVVETGVEPELLKDNDLVRTLHAQAAAIGLPPERVKNKYTMRFEIAEC
jgi:GNAT superfamily N-acetyltransferase